jgi:hypothetical protein
MSTRETSRSIFVSTTRAVDVCMCCLNVDATVSRFIYIEQDGQSND